MLIRSGYHPFVTSYGYNAYYLNVLAGTRGSMRPGGLDGAIGEEE